MALVVLATIPVLDPVPVLPALLRRGDRGQWRQGLRRHRPDAIRARPLRDGWATVVRAALTDYYFNSMRLVPRTWCGASRSSSSSWSGSSGRSERCCCCRSSPCRPPAVFRLAARIVRGEPGRGLATTSLWPYRHAPARSLGARRRGRGRGADPRHERRRRARRRASPSAGRSPRWPAGASSRCGAGRSSPGRSSSTRHVTRDAARGPASPGRRAAARAPAPLRRRSALAIAVVVAVSSILTAAILTDQRGVRRARRLPLGLPGGRPPRARPRRGAPVTLPIQVGPSTITMNRDDRFVVCQPDGRIERQAEEGFFARDTRFVSGYELFLNGQRPVAPQRLAGPVLLVALRVHQPGAARSRRRRAPPQPRAAASTGPSPAASTRTTTSSTTGGGRSA